MPNPWLLRSLVVLTLPAILKQGQRYKEHSTNANIIDKHNVFIDKLNHFGSAGTLN